MTGEAAPSITALILSYNEEHHIGRCIERLAGLAQRVVVIDSFSTDRTVEIARSMGAEILQRKFTNHAEQFNWGMAQAAIATDWTLRMDCDEYLEPGLVETLCRELPALPPTVAAIEFRRKVIFQGKFIRWGGYHRTVLIRLWRTGMAEIENRWMDEHVVLRGVGGDVRRILDGGDLVDENLSDLSWWTDKHNGYATRQMVEYVALEQPQLSNRTAMAADGAARRMRFVKTNVYARLPLYLRAFIYFGQRYVLRLGFLDGRKGLVWHVLQGFWYQMLVDAKVDEARAYIAAHGLDAFRASPQSSS
jgi:glycosyltransferase involved in cell wall biosynthesis